MRPAFNFTKNKQRPRRASVLNLGGDELPVELVHVAVYDGLCNAARSILTIIDGDLLVENHAAVVDAEPAFIRPIVDAGRLESGRNQTSEGAKDRNSIFLHGNDGRADGSFHGGHRLSLSGIIIT